MSKKALLKYVLPVVFLMSLVGIALGGWSFSGGTLDCDGFWESDINFGAQTECAASDVDLVYVWCVNSSTPNRINAPVRASVPGLSFSASEPNYSDEYDGEETYYGEEEYYQDEYQEYDQSEEYYGEEYYFQNIEIDLDQALDANAICERNRRPGQTGTWTIVKALIAESTTDGRHDDGTWSARLTTQGANGETLVETYECGNGTLFADGQNMDNKVRAITRLLRQGVTDLSSLNLLYNCTEVVGSGYIQFNHPDEISVTATERPQLTIQFGNNGNQILRNIRIECAVTQGDAQFTDQVYTHGVFSQVSKSSDLLVFSGLSEMRVGQNYNASFAVVPAPVVSTITCSLFADNFPGGSADTINVRVR